MRIENIKVGDRFKFKTGIGLSKEADGKEFTVVSLDFRLRIVKFMFDNNDMVYNLSFDLFNKAIVSPEKWYGSKLVFNFL